MKGVEREMLLGIIFLVIILLVIALIVVGPALMFSEDTGNQISFREFCIQWGMSDYSEGINQDVIAGNKRYSVKDNCAVAIGKDAGSLSTGDIDNCRNLCKATI